MIRYSYSLTINGTTFNLAKIVDSSTLEALGALCSTEKKSAKSNVSVTVKGAANPTFYQSFMQALLTAQVNQTVGDCLLVITDTYDNSVVFRGYLDNSEIDVSSKKMPDNLTLSALDKTTFLDRKIRWNMIWENESRNKIVQDLLDALWGDGAVQVPYLSTELSDSKKIPHYCVCEDDDITYRDVIDTVLFEAPGAVLWYDPQNDGYRIRVIPTELDPEATYRQVTYTVADGLVTKSKIYDHDGLLLSYPTVVERANTNIYAENISLQQDDDGKVQGQKIQPDHYFPSDGDVKQIFQEFRIADRPYVTKESRLQNEDLNLLYAKDITYQLSSDPRLSVAPELVNIGWDGVPKYYPKKAWLLFKNKNTKESNVTIFSLTGTAVYVDYMNKLTVPEACLNPEEYEVTTIESETEAKAFAQWYYNSQKYGSTISQWSEPEGLSHLGEIVMVAHKETGVQMPHVVVQIVNRNAGGASGTIRKMQVTAISLYGWQTYTASTVKAISKGSNSNPQKSGAKFSYGTALWGETTARGWEGKVGDYYINTETGNMYYCEQDGDATTALWKYIGNFKGKDADIEGFTRKIEYGLSESDTEFIFPDAHFGYEEGKNYGALDKNNGSEIEYGFRNYEWSETVDGWCRGLYVWMRITETSESGVVTYGEPTYCKELTDSLLASCVFELVPTNDCYVVNKAKDGYDTYTAKLVFTGYPSRLAQDPIVTATVKDSKGNVITPSPIGLSWNGNVVTVTVPFKTALEQINITVTGQYGETATCYMIADDQTTYDAYGGKFTGDEFADRWFYENYGGTLEGYSYVNTTTNTIRYYNGSQWNSLTIENNRKAGVIMSKAEKDFWELYENTTEEQKESLWAVYGYKKEIIASAIAAEKIVMYGEGVIASAYVSTDPSEDTEDGFLDPKDGGGNPVPGYRLEGQNGVVRSTEGYFKKCKAKDMDVVGVLNLYKSGTTESGAEIQHPCLTTVKGAKGDSTGVTSNTPTRWSSDELYRNTSIPLNSPQAAQGSYQGNDLLFVMRADRAYSINETYDEPFYDDVTIPVPVGGYYKLETLPTSENRTFANSNSAYYEILVTDLNGSTRKIYSHYPGYNKPIEFSINAYLFSGCEITFNLVGSWSFSRSMTAWEGVRISGNSYVDAPGFWVSHKYYSGPTVWYDEWVNLGTNNAYDPASVDLYISSPISFDSENAIHYCNPTNIIGYSSYTVDGQTYYLDYNVPYKVDGTLKINNVSKTLSWFMRNSATSVTIGYGLSETITLESDGWYYIEATIRVADYEDGVEVMAVYPREDLKYDFGSTGTENRRIRNIYCQSVIPSSLRELKTNIESFTDSALEILKTVGVVSYNFKADMELEEDKRINYIGFIADDTDKRLSGKRQDSMIITNCIGLLIKGLQELSAKVETLEKEASDVSETT